MNQVQATLFLLFQESLRSDFSSSQGDQEIQDFIAIKFLEIYRRIIIEPDERNTKLNIRFLRKINQENLESHFHASVEAASTTESRNNTSTTIFPESDIRTTEDLANHNNLDTEDFLLISDESEDVKPALIIEDTEDEEELRVVFPNHTYRMLPKGIEKIIRRIARGENVRLEGPTCIPGDESCPNVGRLCTSGIIVPTEDLQLLIETAGEAVREAQTRDH